MLKYILLNLLLLIFTANITAQEAFRISVNRITLNLDNRGVLADVKYNNVIENGKLDGIDFLFSGGFWLSGKNSDTIWSNAIATAARIKDYQPGNVDSLSNDPKYIIYSVSDSDPPFGSSWQTWKDAVNIGADFYDGDGDGIYNPVDLNGNNQWDTNEDKPDIIPGSITTWCVYNDGVAASERTYKNVSPLGIEVHQTLFAYKGVNNDDPLASTFFVRYKLINTGKVNSVLDSVYFGAWSDTDIGGGSGYIDDLSGCDTLLNAGYIYNDSVDEAWGTNPPAHFIKILQGPYVYIPGETFIDNNSNGIYNEGIDNPLDTAYNFKGKDLGKDTIPGAKNLGMTSFIGINKYINGDPYDYMQMRNSLKGMKLDGNDYDPCTWEDGEVFDGLNCNDVNPVYLYSGDPVLRYGWVNIDTTDARQLESTGPFKLETGKPVTIIVAYVAGRGTDNLNSITVSKYYCNAIQSFYNNNFRDIPVSVERNEPNITIDRFKLYQNYPSPFNPTTTIRYRIPETGLVTLKVYDILGREAATLVNEEKSKGSYGVEFDGSNLSSGVYFYRIQATLSGGQAGDFIDTKKFVLIK